MYVIYTPTDELYHHGILGQKWGVRRFQNADGSLTPKGQTHREEREGYGDGGKHKSTTKSSANSKSNASGTSKHGKLSIKFGIKRYQNEDGSLTDKGKKRYSEGKQVLTKNGEKVNIAVSKGKKIGDSYETVHTAYVNGKKVATMWLSSEKGDLNINYVTTKTKEKGKGYAQSLMKHSIDYAMATGHKSMSLEVPDGDDDARHIYEKYGFKDTGNRQDDILTVMKKKL